MMNRPVKYARGLLATALLSASVSGFAVAEEVEELRLQVLFGDTYNTYQKEVNKPFWETGLTEASGGAIQTQARAWNEVGIKGPEVFHLIRKGTFPIGNFILGYNVGDIKELEGMDLALLARDRQEVEAVHEVYQPVLADLFEERFGVKLLGLYPIPGQNIVCNDKLTGLSDLEGRKVRVAATTQANLVRHFGGVDVNIAFGEMQTALQTGVVDCGTTSAMAAYNTGWYESAKYMYGLPINWLNYAVVANLKWWNRLNGTTQAFMQEQIDQNLVNVRNAVFEEMDLGVNCMVSDNCPKGKPGGVTMVMPTAEDIANRDRALNETIIPNWAKSCGKECVETWNATVGKVTGFTASAE